MSRIILTIAMLLAAMSVAPPAQAAVVSRDCVTIAEYNSGRVCLEVGQTGTTVDGLRVCIYTNTFLGQNNMRGAYGMILTVRSGGYVRHSRSIASQGLGCQVYGVNIPNAANGTASLSGKADIVNRPDVAFAVNSGF